MSSRAKCEQILNQTDRYLHRKHYIRGREEKIKFISIIYILVSRVMLKKIQMTIYSPTCKNLKKIKKIVNNLVGFLFSRIPSTKRIC